GDLRRPGRGRHGAAGAAGLRPGDVQPQGLGGGGQCAGAADAAVPGRRQDLRPDVLGTADRQHRPGHFHPQLQRPGAFRPDRRRAADAGSRCGDPPLRARVREVAVPGADGTLGRRAAAGGRRGPAAGDAGRRRCRRPGGRGGGGLMAGPSCELPGQGLRVPPAEVPDPIYDLLPADDRGEAVLAGGCFWCTEAVFRRLAGVTEVLPGYAGGSADTANYEAVCSGRTGHAEAIRIRYRPGEISYGQLLKVFLAVAHDPTQKDRQGNDVGSQYRSAIFPLDEGQHEVARAYLAQLGQAGVVAAPLATTLEPLEAFFVAEAYPRDYAARNPGQPYIVFVAGPKLDKPARAFPDKL